MHGGLVREPSPEEKDLERKLLELAKLEARLAERELELATCQAELHAFENHYFQLVGIRQQELQHIEKQIDEYTAYLASAHDFHPSMELKQLYRKLAKTIHPDLASDPEERAQREALMAEANRAYENGDAQYLQAMLDGWVDTSPAAGSGTLAEEIARISRKICQSQQRLVLIEHQLANLAKTDLYRLQVRAQKAQAGGRDLLSEMARELDRQIRRAQERLNDLKSQSS